MGELAASKCLSLSEDGLQIEPENFGRIASYYYLHHETLRHFDESIDSNLDIPDLLKVYL